MADRAESAPLLPTWLSNVVTIAIVATTATVIWTLVSQNALLKAQLIESFATEDIRSFFAPGDELPDVALADVSGLESSLLSELEGGGVIAFLTTTCPYCAESLPEWQRIEEALAQIGQPFVGVSLHPAEMTREYAAAREIAFPLWALAATSDRPSLKVGAVPFTITVNADGTVGEVWRGTVTEDTADIVIRAATERAMTLAVSSVSTSDRSRRGH